MPILNSRRRISPLDLNKNVKIGVAFPLDEVNLFTGTQTVKEQVKSNLINLLLTVKGERVNQPRFGVGIRNLLFENMINICGCKRKWTVEYCIETICNNIKEMVNLFILISPIKLIVMDQVI